MAFSVTVATINPHLASTKGAKTTETMEHSASIKKADTESQMLSWMDPHMASTKEGGRCVAVDDV